jgi:hypothetical protein
MVAMKFTLAQLLVSASLLAASQARANKLPDACGDGKVKFDVYTEGHQPAPARPPAGWAQIVLIENENDPAGRYGDATVRFGLDGEWVGANKGNSYFTVTVNPGAHRLCASMQDESNVELATVTAEPGKVYYFEAQVEVESKYSVTFGLSQLSEDRGQERVDTWKHALGTRR